MADRRMVVRTGTVRTEDGALLVWRADGDGPEPPLLCSNGIGVATFFWHHLQAEFGWRRPVITWDYRGHGNSPVPPRPEQVTVQLCASDLWRIADAAQAPRAVLVGHSMGCQVILEAFRQAPTRVLALVPMLGTAGGALKTFLGLGDALVPVWRALLGFGAGRPGLSERTLRTVLKMPGVWEAVKLLGIVHRDLCPREEFEPYFDHLRKLDLRVWFALAQDLLHHDANDLLAGISVPALVVAGEKDLFTPLDASHRMAKAIPGAELLVLQGGSHAALVEQPGRINEALAGFLRRHGLAGDAR